MTTSSMWGSKVKRAEQAPKQRRKNLLVAGAATLVIALIATVAIVSNGFESRTTPPEVTSVWVWRDTGAAAQYARLNTQTDELDAVHSVDAPSALVQYSDQVSVLTRNNREAWPVDPASPADLTASEAQQKADQATAKAGDKKDQKASASSANSAAGAGGPLPVPEGTKQLVVNDKWAVMLTETNAVLLADLAAGVAPAQALSKAVSLDLTAIAPAEEKAAADKDKQQAASGPQLSAVAIDAKGAGILYSAAANEFYRFNAESGKVEPKKIAGPKGAGSGETYQLGLFNRRWVLVKDDQSVWQEGNANKLKVKLATGARLQVSNSSSEVPVLADTEGLWLLDDAPKRIVKSSGAPAAPTVIDDTLYAAWAGAGAGTMWSAPTTKVNAAALADGKAAKSVALKFPEQQADLADPQLSFAGAGSAAVLNEHSSGLLWRLPDAKLIPIAQWDLFEDQHEKTGKVIVDEVTTPEAPVAEADEFGVRPGEATPLQVLLNDHDANKRDVLTVDPASLSKLDAGFGRLELLPDGQTLMVYPSSTASGSAEFSYKITDGSLSSQSATVRLTVADSGTNSGPEWCPVQGCQRSWPSPEITPGGTTVISVLDSWVDMQGDAMVLSHAAPSNSADPIRAVVTDNGRVSIQHTQADQEGEYPVTLTVTDSLGKQTNRELRVKATSGAAVQMEDSARTAAVKQTVSVNPLQRVYGGSGSYSLVSADSTAPWLNVVAKTASGTIDVTPAQAGSSVVAVTVRDNVTKQEVTGNIRVTAVEGDLPLSLGALRAFVRSGQDTTVDVLATIPGAAGRSLVLTAAESKPSNDAQLHSDIVEHAKLRLSGSAASDTLSRIGTVNVTVQEGTRTATGSVNVFQVPHGAGQGAIAVPDSATVRAGSVVDIPVLENDVAPPGDRLVLNPDITGTDAEGELAFASGATLRYLAPKKPGTYKLQYTTSGASSPEQADLGSVLVNVIASDGNRPPQPAPQIVRLAPGDVQTADIKLSGVDPDGDRVRITDVSGDMTKGVTAALTRGGLRLQAAENAAPGNITMQYKVRDHLGGEGTADLRVIVTAEGSEAPIVYSDYVRAVAGAKDTATVRPLDNDIEPRGGELKLLDVQPQLAGGKAHPDYAKLAQKLDLKALKDGVVKIAPIGENGTVTFRYTVQSAETKSTSDGLIVVQTSARVQTQAPVVQDTVLSAGDRAELEGAGIDVVSQSVRWASGDPAKLKLEMWGSSANSYSVTGQRIKGKYKQDGDVAIFKLSGKDSLGQNVTTYGLLIVPPMEELRLSLNPNFAGLTVKEDEQVNVALNQVIATAGGDKIEFASNALSVSRPNARCEVRGSEIVYTAGKGEPWQDSCVMQARIAGQKAYTTLAVPVTVQPLEPIPRLTNLVRTFVPGESGNVKLTDMVTWEGNREGNLADLNFELTGTSAPVAIRKGASQVAQIEVSADAQPGTQVPAQVSLPNNITAQLIVQVGNAPDAKPRGATVNLNCVVGEPCGAPAVDLPGEFDPFVGKDGAGLKLVSVDPGNCTYGTFSVAGKRVEFSATPKGSGGKCTASFTVEDAQKRVGTGSIELDLQGRPNAPTSLTLKSYGSSSVVLAVELDGTSHPEVTGVEVKSDKGKRASCEQTGRTSYSCEVGGMENGEAHSFTAIAKNKVGDSDPSAAVSAWAYRSPAKPDVSLKAIGRENGQGVLRLEINGGSDVKSYSYQLNGGEAQEVGGPDFTTELRVAPGAYSVTVTPFSRFTPPPASGNANGENTATAGPVQAFGKVHGIAAAGGSVEGGDGARQVSTTITVNDGGQSMQYGIGIGSCVADQVSNSVTLPVTDDNKIYNGFDAIVCAKGSEGDPVLEKTVHFDGQPVPAPALSIVRNDYKWVLEKQGRDYSLTQQGKPSVDDNGERLYWDGDTVYIERGGKRSQAVELLPVNSQFSAMASFNLQRDFRSDYASADEFKTAFIQNVTPPANAIRVYEDSNGQFILEITGLPGAESIETGIYKTPEQPETP